MQQPSTEWGSPGRVLPSSRLVSRKGPRWLVAKVTSSPSAVVEKGKPGGEEHRWD